MSLTTLPDLNYPITAKTIAETIMTGTAPDLIKPFSLARFEVAVPA